MNYANITKQIILYIYNIVRGRFLRHYINTVYDNDDIHEKTTFYVFTFLTTFRLIRLPNIQDLNTAQQIDSAVQLQLVIEQRRHQFVIT